MISIAAVLILLAAVLGSGFMAAVLVSLWHRVRRLEAGDGASSALDQVSGRLELMLDQVQGIADDIDLLRERLDFTERLLSEGRPRDEGTASMDS